MECGYGARWTISGLRLPMRFKSRRNCLKNRLHTIETLRRTSFLLIFVVAAVFASGCGYHVAGHAGNLPSDWRAIAIPAFKNDTTRYRIEQRFTEAIIRQFLQRTKCRLVQNTEDADAVLHGEVLTIETNPMIFNAITGQVTMMLVTVHTKVLLVDNKTQKVVYKNDDIVFREEYQISTDAREFFEEQDPALERLARDLAAQIVSNVVETF